MRLLPFHVPARGDSHFLPATLGLLSALLFASAPPCRADNRASIQDAKVAPGQTVGMAVMVDRLVDVTDVEIIVSPVAEVDRDLWPVTTAGCLGPFSLRSLGLPSSLLLPHNGDGFYGHTGKPATVEGPFLAALVAATVPESCPVGRRIPLDVTFAYVPAGSDKLVVQQLTPVLEVVSEGSQVQPPAVHFSLDDMRVRPGDVAVLEAKADACLSATCVAFWADWAQASGSPALFSPDRVNLLEVGGLGLIGDTRWYMGFTLAETVVGPRDIGRLLLKVPRDAPAGARYAVRFGAVAASDGGVQPSSSSGGSITVDPAASGGRILGNVSGSGVLAVADAIMLIRFAAGLEAPTPEQLALGDVRPFGERFKDMPFCGDGRITAADVVAVLKAVAGLADVL